MPYGTVNADTLVTSTSGGILGAGNASIMKNRLINSDMRIDQRNAGASGTSNDTYVVDRWAYYGSQASKATWQQNAGSVTPPIGFSNYFGFTSSSAYSVGASELFIFAQKVEGFNTSDLGFGTANAKTITISFWVQSSLTGTFGGYIANASQTRNYPFSYTISSANTWEQKSVTIAGDTTGTWVGATNGIGLRVGFSLGIGSTNSTTANSWNGTTNATGVTGATSVVGTSGATFYITGIQLEVGSSATGFEYRQYGTELALCQRYFNSSFPIGTAPADAAGGGLGSTNSYAQNYFTVAIFQFPVAMRAAPTVTYYNPAVSSSNKIRDASGNNYPGYSQAGPTTTGVGVGVSGTNFGGGGTFGFTNYSASAEL